MTPAEHTYPSLAIAFLIVCAVLTFAAFAHIAFQRAMRIDFSGLLDGRGDERASAVCPECSAGKCRNCDSTAWDFVADAPSACACWAANHGGAA